MVGSINGIEAFAEGTLVTGSRKTFEAHGHACVVCGRQGEGLVTFDHILTQKAHPEYKYEPNNLMPVCLVHHNEKGAKGVSWMANKYPQYKKWLSRRSWEFCELKQTWILPFQSQ